MCPVYHCGRSGESKGADNEVRLAEELGIPVVHSVPEPVSLWPTVL